MEIDQNLDLLLGLQTSAKDVFPLLEESQPVSPLKTRKVGTEVSEIQRKLCSGITEKPKDADVTIKLKWATSMLDSKESVEFEELSFDQYVFGETCILNKKGIDRKEKET